MQDVQLLRAENVATASAMRSSEAFVIVDSEAEKEEKYKLLNATRGPETLSRVYPRKLEEARSLPLLCVCVTVRNWKAEADDDDKDKCSWQHGRTSHKVPNSCSSHEVHSNCSSGEVRSAYGWREVRSAYGLAQGALSSRLARGSHATVNSAVRFSARSVTPAKGPLNLAHYGEELGTNEATGALSNEHSFLRCQERSTEFECKGAMMTTTK
ncbi:hypothetical protein C8F01DRAFT_1084590 [Mycena amicta]|nr:hypothetical protein C8F01DRAFT_1084590 [Mycena amicta]